MNKNGNKKEGDPKVQFHKDKLINSKLFMVIDIAESLNTKKEFNKALLLLKLTICNFFENLIYFWVTLFFQGGRWGSNPRPSEPQSDALTN